MANVLIVEDDNDIRESYSVGLARQGHLVAAVASAEEALNLLHGEDYDLMMVDLLLPGMDGAELCRIVRAAPEWHALPIMMISSMAGQMGVSITESDACWAPVDCFVDKHTPLPELMERAAALLAEKPDRTAPDCANKG